MINKSRCYDKIKFVTYKTKSLFFCYYIYRNNLFYREN